MRKTSAEREVRLPGRVAGMFALSLGAGIMRPRQVVVVTPGRAGSELLVDLLGRHPGVSGRGELLAGLADHPHVDPRRAVDAAATRAAFAALRRGRRRTVLCWKAVTNHLRWFPERMIDPVAFLNSCIADDGLLVSLRRRNFVSQALSLMHAEATSFHFRDNGGDWAPQRIEPERLLAQSYLYEEHDAWLAGALERSGALELFYEDDLTDAACQQRTVDAITDRLGLARVSVRSDLVAIAPLRPAGRIANLDEVRAALSGTRYHAMLED